MFVHLCSNESYWFVFITEYFTFSGLLVFFFFYNFRVVGCRSIIIAEFEVSNVTLFTWQPPVLPSRRHWWVYVFLYEHLIAALCLVEVPEISMLVNLLSDLDVDILSRICTVTLSQSSERCRVMVVNFLDLKKYIYKIAISELLISPDLCFCPSYIYSHTNIHTHARTHSYV